MSPPKPPKSRLSGNLLPQERGSNAHRTSRAESTRFRPENCGQCCLRQPNDTGRRFKSLQVNAQRLVTTRARPLYGSRCRLTRLELLHRTGESAVNLIFTATITGESDFCHSPSHLSERHAHTATSNAASEYRSANYPVRLEQDCPHRRVGRSFFKNAGQRQKAGHVIQG